MQVGVKATKHAPYEKMCVHRHGNKTSRATADRLERTIEKRVRAEGKRQAREDPRD